MTALPEWMREGLTVKAYEALPEEISRRIEVVDGAVIVNASPRRAHQLIVFRLADAIFEAVNDRYAVTIDADLRLRDEPLANRRPDIAVYDASLPDDAVLRPEHCVLVIEVMSPGSVTADQIDKPAEYADAGIKHFWRVEGIDAVNQTMTVVRYRLDPTTRVYVQTATDTDVLTVDDPVSLSIKLADLF